jgi:hypothetical protein
MNAQAQKTRPVAGIRHRRRRPLVARGADAAELHHGAEEARAKWGLPNLTVGYGVSIVKAREWGLYISSSRGMTSAGIEEPSLFAEPGLFLIKPDGTLYWSNVSTMPFARPHFNEISAAVDFAVSKNYPARGEA